MPSKSNSKLSPLIRAILDTIVYADVFDYPLTKQQIHRYLTGLCAPPELVFDQLKKMGPPDGILQNIGQYTLLVGRENIVKTRVLREKVAARLWPAALRYGKLIAGLPFVRMVAVTGSLAMNNVDENGDIDYLIVTANGRLWLCRLLVLGVVWLAARERVSLCPNYLITERALEISNHSLYAAHEFAQMVPVAGLEVYLQMRQKNPWVNDYLPNATGAPGRGNWQAENEKTSLLRRLSEKILLTPAGTRVEAWEMRRKVRKLSLENNDNPETLFNADICKGHSNRHGQRTEKNLNERLDQLILKVKNE